MKELKSVIKIIRLLLIINRVWIKEFVKGSTKYYRFDRFYQGRVCILYFLIKRVNA